MGDSTHETQTADQLELLAYLLEEEEAAPLPPDDIPRQKPHAGLPLSLAQQRLWFLHQLENHGPAYNIPLAYRLSGPLNVAALQASLTQLLARHAALRTTFAVANGEPTQTVNPAQPVSLPVTLLTHLPATERAAEAARRCAEAAQTPLSLTRSPLLRASLFQLNPTEHVLLLLVHHIAADGWSIRLLLAELTALYNAFATGHPSPLAEPPLTYSDFAVWQRQQLTTATLAGDLTYWRTRLANPPLLGLPTDFPHPASPTFAGDSQFCTLPPTLSHALKQLARQENVTPFMVLLAAFYGLLYRYTGQTDLLVGTPIANRDRAELERVVGFFANTLVLRTRLTGDLSFIGLLRQVKETTLDALAHQQLPFERLVEALQPERSLSRNPLFQVMFSYWDDPEPGLTLTGLTVEELTVQRGTAKFDLHLAAANTPDSLRLELEYSTDLFRPASAARLLAHFQTLLHGIVANPEQAIAQLPLLSLVEQSTLLYGWNKTDRPLPATDGVHQLFETQAQRTPARPAAEFNGQALTYAELEQQANRLAQHLLRLGVNPGQPVGLCLDPGLELPVALLAVLKTGAACLPLDPSYPPARLHYMLADADPPVLLANPHRQALFAGYRGQILFPGDEAACRDEPLAGPVDPRQPVYIMYTSGSTGQPKGVALPHRALLNLLHWQRDQLNPGGRRTLQFTPLSFDVSFQEIFATWHTGGTLVLLPAAVRRNPQELLQFITRQRLERIFLPFVALNSLAEAVATATELPLTLTEIITAGEQLRLTPAIVQFFSRLPGCTLHNHYGPTETHVATAHTLTGPPAEWPPLPPIGRPIANTQVYLLDARWQPVPTGLPGELYLGGAGLADGYLHRPGLTAERFVPHPFAPGQRLYRTGDLARYLPDGALEFLGRADRQLKIRGFRVEPGEVETALSQHPAVKTALVAAADSPAGEQQLVAYVIPHQTAPALADIRAFLQPHLPDYMLPAALVVVEHFPLTPSGKIDLRALPRPAASLSAAAETFNPPATSAEQALAEIWANLLGVTRVSRADNFFELGGHSLLAIRLFAAIEAKFGSKPPLAALFEQPTLAGLAAAITPPINPTGWQPLVLIKPGNRQPPLFLVHGFGGGVTDYGRLANLLDDARPVFGLVARGVDDPGPPHPDIETMAAAYVQAVRSVQPAGPYFLGGYCFGGLVAFEMARQLQAQHERVALLAMLEAYAPAGPSGSGRLIGLSNMARNLPYWLTDFVRLGLKPMARRTLRRARLAGKTRRGQRQQINLSDVLDETGHIPNDRRPLMEAQLQAMLAYNPPAFDGQITLFRVRGLALLNSKDPQLGWGRLAAGVETRLIGGSHGTILQEPHVHSLAAALNEQLRRTETFT